MPLHVRDGQNKALACLTMVSIATAQANDRQQECEQDHIVAPFLAMVTILIRLFILCALEMQSEDEGALAVMDADRTAPQLLGIHRSRKDAMTKNDPVVHRSVEMTSTVKTL